MPPASDKQKAPAYQWYPKDYDTDEEVKLMTYEEEGIYRRLLDHQWLHGGIPADVDRIGRLVPKVSAARFKRLWPSMSMKFEPKDGRLVNPRLERARAETGDFRDDKSRAGIASAEARRQKFGTAQPLRTDAEQNAEQPVRSVRSNSPEPASASASPSASSAADRTDVLEHFRTAWKAAYGYDCSLILKPLEEMQLEQQCAAVGEAQLDEAIAAYFASDDPFVVKAKHPLPLFLRDPLKYLAKAKTPTAPGPTGVTQTDVDRVLERLGEKR